MNSDENKEATVVTITSKDDESSSLVQEEEEEEEEEDDWGLACDFFLFAQHQAQPIWMGSSSLQQQQLEILCVESLTPLDMVQLGAGVHDATGHCVWTACFLWIASLSQVWPPPTAMNDNDDDDTLCVLELGSGTGLGGLALWHYVLLQCNRHKSIHVSLTDADPEALALCRRNVAHNAHLHDNNHADDGLVAVEALVWGEPVPTHLQHAMHVILAADILYDIRLLPAICKSATDVARHDDNGATFYLAHVPRACYNADTAPDAPEKLDLEAYIVHQMTLDGFWQLHGTWRPLDLVDTWKPPTSNCINDVSLQEMQDAGATLMVFVHNGGGGAG